MKKLVCLLMFLGTLTAVAGVPGTYVLDKVSLEKSMHEMMAKQMESVPEEQRAGAMEMAKTQVQSILDNMNMKAVLKGDGTVEMNGNMGAGGPTNAVGTWSLEGDQLTMTKTHENGEEVESDSMVATFKDGKIIMQPEGSPFPVYLVRE